MEIHALALGLFITHSNLSKMKRITGLLLVFCFALCMVAPTVNASVFDDDVGVDIHQGVTFTQGVFVTDLPEIATPAIAHVMILQSECPPSLPTKKANYKECPNVMRTVTFWHGGDSKASLCKAYNVNHNRATTSLKYNSTKYGKGKKRLPCEAKA